MARTRSQKKEILQQLRQDLEKAQNFCLFDFRYLTSEEMAELRFKIKEKGGRVKVVKKTILEIALRELGIEIPVRDLEGQLAVCLMGEDFISPVKTLHGFSENKEVQFPQLVAGYIEGQVMKKEDMLEIAKLPSLQELQAQVVYNLSYPLAGFLSALRSPQKGLLIVLSSKS